MTLTNLNSESKIYINSNLVTYQKNTGAETNSGIWDQRINPAACSGVADNLPRTAVLPTPQAYAFHRLLMKRPHEGKILCFTVPKLAAVSDMIAAQITMSVTPNAEMMGSYLGAFVGSYSSVIMLSR